MNEYYGAPNDFRSYSNETHEVCHSVNRNSGNSSIPTVTGISKQQRDAALRSAKSVYYKYNAAKTRIADAQRQLDSKNQIAEAVYTIINKYASNDKIMADSEYNYLNNFVNTTQVMLRKIGQWTE